MPVEFQPNIIGGRLNQCSTLKIFLFLYIENQKDFFCLWLQSREPPWAGTAGRGNHFQKQASANTFLLGDIGLPGVMVQKERSRCECEKSPQGRCGTQWVRIGFYISPLIQYSLLSPCFRPTSVTCGPLGASQGVCVCVWWRRAAICWRASARRKEGVSERRSEGGCKKCPKWQWKKSSNHFFYSFW